MAPRLFTLSEANALLPTLTPVVRELVEAQRGLRAAEAQLDGFRARATLEGGVVPDAGLRRAKLEAERLAEKIRSRVAEVEARGCLVKDLDRGLVDFLSIRAGEQVYLCWRLGEPSIGFWHGLDEGFVGRKPVTSED
ncbi:MAG: DUF2203 domain-containing protein [Candidatus Methylomirabilales bacterium]